MTNTPARRSLAALVLLGLALLVVGCSSSDAPMAESAGDTAAGGDSGADSGAVERGFSEDGEAAPQSGANRTVVQVRSMLKTGEVALTRPDVDAARRELGDLLDRLGGYVDRESTQHDRRGGIEHATVVVRVPVVAFEDAMERIRGLGRERHSDTTSEDVHQQVIDIDERVETLQNSLDRLQEYQSEAADIDDLIRFEDQITQRESELQSLRAQQAYLADQTSMSTITVRMSAPDTYVPPPSALEDAGFLAGLTNGWNALKDTVVVALTVVGAVLPFAVALAVVGVPAWVLVRRTLRSRAAPAVPAETPAE